MKTRYLIISCLYPSADKENIAPLLCIAGKWLENAGFTAGSEVGVRVEGHGKLVISLLPEKE